MDKFVIQLRKKKKINDDRYWRKVALHKYYIWSETTWRKILEGYGYQKYVKK